MLIGFVKKGQMLFIFSFTALILLGTLLLKLPFAYQGDLCWADSLFTATSAVCVTGLMTVPTSQFTLFGQLVILGLIQLGGIGIMTLSASILLMIGRGLSFSNTLMISSLSDNFSLRGTEGLTRTVIQYTLVSEGIGMLLLLPGFLADYPWAEGIYYSLFHSVSAFCNAGISIFDNNLIGQNRWIQLVIAGLIVLGGLGVYVIYDLIRAIRNREWKLRVHSKLVLLSTLILIVGGMLLLRGGGFRDGGILTWFDSFFQSVTARTAGFNTIDLTLLPAPSLTLLIVLMLIGASPGSTGGGMKTSTVALAVAAIYNTFKGNAEVLMFRRKIPMVNVLRSYTIIVTFLLLSCGGAIVIQLLTGGSAMMDCFFESASALGTVGLSLGTTAKLTLEGKLFVSLYMLVGRIGPFTAMLFLLGREKKGRLKYPEERIIIG